MASGTIPHRITEIIVAEANADIAANADHAQVTANPPAGYNFLCWTSCATVGFVGAPYMDTPNLSSTYIWTSIKPTSQKNVRGIYLCYR